ncbi:MAG: hypothetical protein LBR84_00525 [Tannerella sp.]|nr:hypothetical protein [Tannerella sp.]
MCILFGAGSISAQVSDRAGESVWGLQAGLGGLWINNERRLGDVFTIKSEINLTGAYSRNSAIYVDPGSHEVSAGNGESYAIVPLIAAAPRWYYNLKRRAAKGRNTANNAADYLSIELTVNPGFAIISNNTDVEPAISIIPVWGLRRNLSRHFNFELSGGIGYHCAKSRGSDLGINLTIRLGYVF